MKCLDARIDKRRGQEDEPQGSLTFDMCQGLPPFSRAGFHLVGFIKWRRMNSFVKVEEVLVWKTRVNIVF